MRRAVALLLCTAPGCVFLRPAAVPMPAVRHAAVVDAPQGLIVMLPGLADGPEVFERNAFVDLVRDVHPGYDVIVADAHFAYYRTATIVQRLHEDVIAPVRPDYERIWLLGVSMGGLGASVYALEHGDVVDGLILLAPYMGPDEIIEEVQAAGGLAAWAPPAGWQVIEDEERRRYYELWNWFRGYTDPAATRPELFLGFGAEDRLGVPNQLVASVLPAGQREVVPGGHAWQVWRTLLETLLPRAIGASADVNARPARSGSAAPRTSSARRRSGARRPRLRPRG